MVFRLLRTVSRGVALCAVTLLASCGGASLRESTPGGFTDPASSVWSDGTYVLEERRAHGEMRLTLSRVDDAYFSEALTNEREPGGQCIAVGEAEDTSFDCFVPYQDASFRFVLRRAEGERGLTVEARTSNVDASFFPEALVLREANVVSLVGPHFIRDTLAHGGNAAEDACAAEYGEGSPRCPTLDAVLGESREALLGELVRRVAAHESATSLSPLDALLTLRQTLRGAIQASNGTVTAAHIDRAIAVCFANTEDEPLRRTALSPADIEQAQGVWMPTEQRAGVESELVEIASSALGASGLDVRLCWSGDCAFVTGPMLTPLWQTYDNRAQHTLLGEERTFDFRIRLVGGRLEVREISEQARRAYRVYRRVDVLRELFERAAADTGRHHGSETTAALGSVADAVFGDDPAARAEQMRSELEGALGRHHLSVDGFSLDELRQFVGEFVLGVGVVCAEAAPRDAVTFSACVGTATQRVAEALVAAREAHSEPSE